MKTVLICLAILPFIVDSILAIPLEDDIPDGIAARTFLQPNMKCEAKSAFKQINIQNSSMPSSGSRTCKYGIRPFSLKVCQLRIEINIMDMTPPSFTATQHALCRGSRLIVDGLPFDLCGRMSFQHVYVPFNVNRLTDEKIIEFRVSANEIAYWDITVNQIECDHKAALVATDERQAPDGCLQYFYQDTGRVESFNHPTEYIGGAKYAICFNRNYNQDAVLELSAIKFNMDSNGATNGGFDDECLEVDAALTVPTTRRDYIAIPFAEFIDSAATIPRQYHNLFCDKSLDGKTLEYRGTGPIVIHVNTDEVTTASKETGFQFTYKITN